MLSEEQLEALSWVLVPLFQYLENEVIKDVARRIEKTTMLTRTAELMAMDMLSLGYSPAKIQAEALKLLNADKKYKKAVEDNTIEYKKEIKQLIADIVAQAQETGDTIVANAGEMAWIDDLRVWQSNGQALNNQSFLPQLVRAFQRQNRDAILNLTRTTGFKDKFKFTPIQNIYTDELNKATIKICSGTFSQKKVVDDCIKNLADSGLRTIDYGTGKTMQLDSAVRLATRTGCHQIAGEISKENILSTGVSMVYVGQHWGARNTGTGIANHAEWQGKVYYFGEKPNEEALKEEAQRIGQDRIEDLWEATGYSIDGKHESNPLGLYGYNCRHRHYAWWEGISEKPKENPEPAPKVINGKKYDYYAMTQEMRKEERNIRYMKREREALQSLGKDTSVIDAKIKNATKDYRQFCKDADIKSNSTHLQYHAGTSDIRNTQAYKNMQNEVNEIIVKAESKELKSCVSIKQEMLDKATPKEGKITLDDRYIAPDGTEYIVNGKNIIQNNSEKEIFTANLLLEVFGGDIHYVPEVKGIAGVHTPDFLWNNEKWELKNTKSDIEGIRNIIHKKKEQADAFIIDVTTGDMTEDFIKENAHTLFEQGNTKKLQKLMFIKDGKVIEILKRI